MHGWMDGWIETLGSKYTAMLLLWCIQIKHANAATFSRPAATLITACAGSWRTLQHVWCAGASTICCSMHTVVPVWVVACAPKCFVHSIAEHSIACVYTCGVLGNPRSEHSIVHVWSLCV
jgi:hypothetical protein